MSPETNNFISGSFSPLTTSCLGSDFLLDDDFDDAQLGNKSDAHKNVVNSLFFILFVLFCLIAIVSNLTHHISYYLF